MNYRLITIHILIIILFSFATGLKAAQQGGGQTSPQNRPAETSNQQQGTNSSTTTTPNGNTQNRLSTGYRGVLLGMSLKKVREILKKDRLLEIDIRTDFGDLDEEPYHVLRARNVPYIKSVYYQFGTTQSVKRKLFAIIIHFNKRYNSFHMLYNKMKKKYGEAKLLTPRMAIWENTKVKIMINSPSTVKFIDLKLYKLMQREYTYLRHRYFPPTDEAANRELTDGL